MEINLSKNRFTIVVKRKSATWHLGTRYKQPSLLKVDVDCKESQILGIASKVMQDLNYSTSYQFANKAVIFSLKLPKSGETFGL